MSEREFWLAVRRALLMICAAIEKRYLQPRKDLPRELRGMGPVSSTEDGPIVIEQSSR